MDQAQPHERIDGNIQSLASHQQILQDMLGEQGKKIITLNQAVTQLMADVQSLRSDINIVKALGIGHGPTAHD